MGSLSALINHALLDRKVTVAEARQLEAAAVTPGDRAALQSLVNTWGDRFATGASTVLKQLAPENRADPIRADLRSIQAKGFVHRAQLEALLADVKQGGVTDAERRELVRDVGSLPTTASAHALLESFRTERQPGESAENPFNQRLPCRPGDAGNRLRNDATGGQLFPVKHGTPLSDGLGRVRGTVVNDGVKVNFGQRKLIKGRPYVYAFSTRIKDAAGKSHGVSGWIPESALRNGPLTQMPTIDAPRPPQGDLPQHFKLGGAPTTLYGDLKVNPGVPRHAREAAGDYLTRPGGVVNMLFSLPGAGGVSNDTFHVGADFVPAKGVPRVRIPLYLPKDATANDRAMLARHPTQEFVYGRVGSRYGWVAAPNLQPA